MPETRAAARTATYHAHFTLDPSGQWIAEIEELPAVHTFGRTLGKAREYLADALALWLDVPVDSLKNRIEFETPSLPSDIQVFVERAVAEKEIAESACQLASNQVTQAALHLVEDAHLSLRDAAEVLGLSHQRVQQLLTSARAERKKLPLASTVPDDLLNALREYLPGGTKEDLGTVVGLALLGLAIAWIESRSR